MKAGPRIAAAVAVGYALGRTRKMKMAITVGGILAGRRLGVDPKDLVQKGGKLLASSSEFTELSSTVRGQLLDAAKTAATAAASNKIESLGASLSERAAKVREPGSGDAVKDEAGDTEPSPAQPSLQDTEKRLGPPRDDQRAEGASERPAESGASPPRRSKPGGSPGPRRASQRRPSRDTEHLSSEARATKRGDENG